MMLAILQARMTSSRLPGKVLATVVDKPLLGLQLDRIRAARQIDKVVVATSTDTSDDAIVEFCENYAVPCFRGELSDVLSRFYHAAKTYAATDVVRLTGDCPLADPEVIDEVIELYSKGGYDYASNTIERTFPDGLDVEVFRFDCLGDAFREARLPQQREHVTPFIYGDPKRYKLGNLRSAQDLSALRWTLDEAADLELIRRIYEALYPTNPRFTTADILDLLKRNPELKIQNVPNEKPSLSVKLRKSLRFQEHAKERIPGLSQLLSKRPDMFSYGVWPGYFSRAKGCEIWDLDGNRYVDMSISGIGANVLGYADAEVDEKVCEAIANGTSSSLNCPEEVELADLLCEIHPWAQQVRLTRTGGEAMAVAVRIARASTGCDKVAVCGYHGWHDWYLAANLGTENALGEHLIPGLRPNGVPKVLAGTALAFRYNKLRDLEEIVARHGKELAAIVMEPIRNEKPEAEFISGVRRIADETGALLLIDEISAGFRMNSGGAHLVLGIQPDIAVFSKAMGNGYPIGAVIGKASAMEAAQTSFISSTYWTERIGPVAALATIRKHQRLNVGAHLTVIGEMMQEGWRRLGAEHALGVHVGGMPELAHFSFDGELSAEMKAYFVQLMLEEGFLASTSFYPMLAHSTNQVEAYLEAASRAFSEIASAAKRGDLKAKLIGRPAASGFARLN